jgi:hypothetical protein
MTQEHITHALETIRSSNDENQVLAALETLLIAKSLLN